MSAAIQSLKAPAAPIAGLKTPPHSVDAEQSLIAAVVSSNKILYEVDWLTDEDFFRHEHILIWRQIQAMALQSFPIDAVTLIAALDRADQLNDAGGVDYLTDILTNGRGSSNAAHYANIIRDRAVSRRLIRTGYEIAEIGFGSEEAQGKIDQAQTLTSDIQIRETNELTHINQIMLKTIEGIDHRFQHKGEIIGLETGFKDLDEATCGLSPGDFVVVAGRPSMGKTTLAMNISENAALKDHVVVVFSLEMPSEQLSLRNLSSLGSVPHGRLRSGKLHDDDWPGLTAAASKIKDKPLYILDDTTISSTQMLSQCRKLSNTIGRKIELVVVDYMQLFSDKSEEGSTQRMTGISRNMKAAARVLGCPVIALSQLNRSVESRPKNNRRPVMSDLRESGAIEQDADIIIMTYRDEVYNENTNQKGVAEAIIRKQRNGPIKTIYLRSQLEYSRFRDIAGGYVAPSQEDSFSDMSGGIDE